MVRQELTSFPLACTLCPHLTKVQISLGRNQLMFEQIGPLMEEDSRAWVGAPTVVITIIIIIIIIWRASLVDLTTTTTAAATVTQTLLHPQNQTEAERGRGAPVNVVVIVAVRLQSCQVSEVPHNVRLAALIQVRAPSW